MLKFNGKIHPHCGPCGEPLWKSDRVHTDTMFEQIQHVDCFTFQPKYIKDTGTFGEIVSRHPIYI
ncbi:hypothetical protein J7I91_21640 [Pseudomonas sp. ISL-84]|nr:hypothetical protein [Pseudomonas sp. ISL-84]